MALLVKLSKKNKGFTLIEVLISMIILTVLLLGLLGALAKAIDLNVRNYLRDEAVKIAQEKLEEYRNIGFDNVVSGNSTLSVPFRNNNYTFTLNSNVDDFSDFKKITLTVNWSYKGKNYTYSLYTALRKD